jgi:hypothetical protein
MMQANIMKGGHPHPSVPRFFHSHPQKENQNLVTSNLDSEFRTLTQWDRARNSREIRNWTGLSSRWNPRR